MELFRDISVIEEITLDLLEGLQKDPALDSFFLVGGTALALQLGHRLSIDLDFFTTESFDIQPLIDHLAAHYSFSLSATSKNTILGFVDQVKVDFITHPYALVEPLVLVEHLRLASLLDIGAMKLNAIANSGERYKDFIDVYYLLERFSLDQLLEAYAQKYLHSSPMIPLKAITYFDDLDMDIDPPVLKMPLEVDAVKERLMAAVESTGRIFR